MHWPSASHGVNINPLVHSVAGPRFVHAKRPGGGRLPFPWGCRVQTRSAHPHTLQGSFLVISISR